MRIDDWIKTKIGLSDFRELTRKDIEDYQLSMLRETLNYVKNFSPYYRKKLNDIDSGRDIISLDDLSRIPFTTPEDLKEHGTDMVCVSQGRISRIVTLDTSGSTGKPKRIYFTEDDQELTIDYFNYGMRVMTESDDTFMVLLPCKTPGSVGDLLRMGLERNDVKVIPFGYPAPDGSQDEEIIYIMKEKKVTSLVGTAPSISRLALKSSGIVTTIRTVLLSAEYVSEKAVKSIENSWNSSVFEHFGMTETGLGGAMACEDHVGYHPREADLLFEIIDPETGKVLDEGQRGELVFTTLTRKGMPFIRYRTGDMSRWIPGSCPCGSILRRIDKVEDRNALKIFRSQ